MHDLIGDIHGHADALLKILRQLGDGPCIRGLLTRAGNALENRHR
jgi:hypothetical protein